MSHRTVSLLLLFAGALLLTGIVLALVLRIVEGTAVSGPWVAPMAAVCCHTAMLYAGRRFVLPPSLAVAPARAALALGLVVSVTLAATLALMSLLSWWLGAFVETPSISLPVWFLLLWLVLPRSRGASPHSVRVTSL